jgi:hypothetical protein
MQSNLFCLREAKFWGDYGHILLSGFASRDTKTGHLLLDRAGPFAPPIFYTRVPLIGYVVVVTQSFRKKLEQANLGQFTFKPAIKNRIIDIPWHTWDRKARLPAQIPASGEPEEYILDRKHSQIVATQMEELWEFIAPVIPCNTEREKSETTLSGYTERLYLTPAADIYRGLFRTDEKGKILFVDLSARQWFEREAGEWVRFTEVIQK